MSAQDQLPASKMVFMVECTKRGDGITLADTLIESLLLCDIGLRLSLKAFAYVRAVFSFNLINSCSNVLCITI